MLLIDNMLLNLLNYYSNFIKCSEIDFDAEIITGLLPSSKACPYLTYFPLVCINVI